MQDKNYGDMNHRNQDKVRIRVGEYKGQKGSIQKIADDVSEVMLNNGVNYLV